MCQNLLVPALDAGTQKDRPYQSDFYRAGFNAIPRGAREQDSFDTPPYNFPNNLPIKSFFPIRCNACVIWRRNSGLYQKKN